MSSRLHDGLGHLDVHPFLSGYLAAPLLDRVLDLGLALLLRAWTRGSLSSDDLSPHQYSLGPRKNTEYGIPASSEYGIRSSGWPGIRNTLYSPSPEYGIRATYADDGIRSKYIKNTSLYVSLLGTLISVDFAARKNLISLILA